MCTNASAPVAGEAATNGDARRAFRTALGTFATGVTIVTGSAAGGVPIGLTVNSFASVSLDPPLVLWSLSGTSGLADCFDTGRAFAISVLRSDQEPIARRFATAGVDRFAGVRWSRGEEGVPLLDEALACFECRTDSVHVAGDHRVYLARVVRYRAGDGAPLVFARGSYRALCDG